MRLRRSLSHQVVLRRSPSLRMPVLPLAYQHGDKSAATETNTDASPATTKSSPSTTGTTAKSTGEATTYTQWPPTALITPISQEVTEPQPAEDGDDHDNDDDHSALIPCTLWFFCKYKSERLETASTYFLYFLSRLTRSWCRSVSDSTLSISKAGKSLCHQGFIKSEASTCIELRWLSLLTNYPC